MFTLAHKIKSGGMRFRATGLGIQPPQAAQAMNVFLDRKYASDRTDQDARAHIQRYATQVYGVDLRAGYFNCGNMGDVVATLRRFSIIEHLVFFFHGIKGLFLIGSDEVSMTQMAVAFDAGNKGRPQVRQQIHVASCSVVEAPYGMVDLARCFKAPLVDGFTWHHYVKELQLDAGLLKTKDGQARLDAALKKYNRALPRFLVQPRKTVDELLASGGSQVHVSYEWWSGDLDFNCPEPTERTAGVRQKSAVDARLCQTTANRIADAAFDSRDFVHIEVRL